MATIRRATASIDAFQPKIVDDTRLNHLRVQGEEHELGIEIGAGIERGLDSPFDVGRKSCVIGGRERIAAGHAIGDDLGGLAVGAGLGCAILGSLLQKLDSGAKRNPFIHPQGLRRYIKQAEKTFRETLEKQRQTLSPGDGKPPKGA